MMRIGFRQSEGVLPNQIRCFLCASLFAWRVFDSGGRGTRKMEGSRMAAVFRLANVGISNRFKMKLFDSEGEVIFNGQPREMKPMCIDELALLRSVCEKDSHYEKISDDRGYHYVLRARDGHELGHGSFFNTEQEMLDQIEAVKAVGATAELVDETPEETRIRTYDYVREETGKLLKEMGIDFA